MITDKANTICLFNILSKYSDENHILPMREIISKMKAEYGICPDRRTIYSSIAVLLSFGVEISTYEENGVGYYLKQRLFETSEVRMLMDAVYSFRFLPPKHTEDLVEKLQNVLSVYERKRFRHLTITRTDLKSLNRQVFWNIEQLDEAISKKVKVRFTYLQYDINKNLVPRREEKYTVNPYGMVIHNENYYLICIKENKTNVSMYRIDRIKDIEITDAPLDPWKYGFPPCEMTERAVYAYAGKPELVTMICDRSVLDHVIDKFGLDIHIRDIGDEKLEISFTVAPEGVVFWALQYLPHVEVTSPQWLRDEIIECLKSNPYIKA